MTQTLAQTWDLLERQAVFTPLGIRFFDPARGQPIRDQLSVVALPVGSKSPATGAFRTASGLYAFQGLPGLHDIEPAQLENFVGSPPIQAEFVIEVQDRLRRFLPVSFVVTAPVKGIYPGSLAGNGSPPTVRPPGVYLFSAPNRYVAPGLAAIRAQLVDFATGGPAAHAVLEVQLGDLTWRGMADARGSALVLFPYPRASFLLAASPPQLETPPNQQEWQLTVRVRYEPPAVRFSAGAQLPDLLSLFDQSTGAFRPTAVGPAGNEITASLQFGQPLVLRSLGQSELFIESGASPP